MKRSWAHEIAQQRLRGPLKPLKIGGDGTAKNLSHTLKRYPILLAMNPLFDT
jgi:hypothetical protein